MFSDNDDDRYKWPKKPKPEDPNQMVMPFLINEIDGVKVNQEVLTCTP